MTESRTKNTKRNIVYSFFDTFLNMGFQFVSRSVIVYVFNDQYLGLSSLFTSVINVLNMADLGFSVAIVYNMYKPISEHDVEKVCALLNYYKKIYHIVGMVMMIIGGILIPIIPYLIKDEYPREINIYFVYILYLVNTVLSYFLYAYKSALLNALQRLDLTKVAYSIASFIQYGLQLACLLIFENYYAFMVCMILGTGFKNFFCAYISKKKYPEYECKGTINTETKKDVVKRVKGLLISNISGVTYTTFDSIILSAFIGLSTVAVYNNYIVVFNGVMNFVVLIRNAMQASVGNSIALESKEKNYNDMLLWQFLFSVIAIWCSTCMLCLYQPFMELWMGDDLLLQFRDVILICIWFFFSVIPHAFYLYMSGSGMWWEMRWPYILSTVCNLLLNIVLGKIMGVTGIIFSTVFSSVIFGMIWQCLILFKKYYKEISPKKYFIRQIVLLFVGIVTGFVSFFICNAIEIYGILGLIIKGIICTTVVVIMFFILYRKTEVFIRAKNFFRAVVHL